MLFFVPGGDQDNERRGRGEGGERGLYKRSTLCPASTYSLKDS